MDAAASHDRVLVIDLGAQYANLIARRVRENNVFSEVVPRTITPDEVTAHGATALILSGGPDSVYVDNAPAVDPGIYDLGLPMLGICYGQQLMARDLGGTVANNDVAEYGRTDLTVTSEAGILQGLPAEQKVWMSHRDAVTSVPDGFVVTAQTANAPCAVFESAERKMVGIQFHPEVSHTPHGKDMLAAFLTDVAGCTGDWTTDNIADELADAIREQVGGAPVLCGLSGGVDSAVTAALIHKAVPGQLTCVFVDHGLMRADEGADVATVFRDHFNVDLVVRDEEDRFLGALAGVTDPEEKRKIIGHEFIEVFNDAATSIYDGHDGTKFLAQGTLYPDVIESGSGTGETIKSHHNVGGLPDDLQFDLVEPLRLLFKDEVRELGRALGLPDHMVQRQPFPGPGLAVRIVGDITKERLDLVRAADAIFLEELAAAGLDTDIWQSFAALLGIRSVGVQGDARTYGHPIVLRAVSSEDAMTADWTRIPHDVLERVSTRITNEVRGINRVVLDITSKPPGTIEWE